MVGHIKRVQACHLSPLIDRGDLLIEGYVQGSKGAYTMPVDIVCFGPPQAQAAVASRLRQGGIQLMEADPEDFMGGEGAGGAGAAAASMGGGGRLSSAQMDHRLEKMFDGGFRPR